MYERCAYKHLGYKASHPAFTWTMSPAPPVWRLSTPPNTTPVRLPWSGTFHSIANRIIRRHAAAVGLDTSFSVLDRGDAADLMDVLRHELGFSKAEKRFPRKDTCLAIYSHRVNTQRPLADTFDALFPWCAEWESQLTELYRAYVDKKLANQAPVKMLFPLIALLFPITFIIIGFPIVIQLIDSGAFDIF